MFGTRLDAETMGLLRAINRKLDHVHERLKHMATQAQIDTLKADIAALIAAALAHAATPDPALDALDEQVKQATQQLTAPVAPAPPAAPGS